MMAAINAALDTKLDQLAARIENMVTSKIEELERKFENVEDGLRNSKMMWTTVSITWKVC